MRSVRTSLSLVAVVVVALAALAGCDPAPRRLAGQVLDGGTTPVAGVTVEVFADDAETLVAATVTGPDGGFRFDEGVVADGVDYRVRADRDTWYGGTDWASATSVTAGETTSISIDVDFEAGTVAGVFDDFEITGEVTLENLAGGVPTSVVLPDIDQVAFSFDDVAPGTYRLVYEAEFFDSPSARNATAPFEVAAGGTVVRDDPFPATNSVRIWVTLDPEVDLAGPAGLRLFVRDAETGEIVSEGRRRMNGMRDLRIPSGRTFTVLILDRDGVVPAQFLGESVANPEGEVFGPSNPLIGDSTYVVHP